MHSSLDHTVLPHSKEMAEPIESSRKPQRKRAPLRTLQKRMQRVKPAGEKGVQREANCWCASRSGAGSPAFDQCTPGCNMAFRFEKVNAPVPPSSQNPGQGWEPPTVHQIPAKRPNNNRGYEEPCRSLVETSWQKEFCFLDVICFFDAM